MPQGAMNLFDILSHIDVCAYPGSLGLYSVVVPQRKSLMSVFKMQICQGQSFKNRSLLVEPCTAFYFFLIVGQVINQNVDCNC